jgi:nicotinamide-nucleotide amidase
MNLHAEVISIGDELLAGNIVNGNASFISRKLHELGIDVSRQISLPDEVSALSEGLSESMSCAPLVIATGGLGPTIDDCTRQVVADLFDTPLVVNEELKSYLLGKYGSHTAIENQSTQPKKAMIFRNAQGTAPGLALASGQSTLILLPGVPYEMEALLMEQVIPFIQSTFQLPERRYETSLHFFHLNESSVDPLLREIKEEYPDLHIGIYPRNGLVSVNLSGKVIEVDKAKERISGYFEEHLYDSEDGKVETAVHHLFTEKKLKLAIAESCTGGLMAARLTANPGASNYFQGSLVVYSNAWKETLLGIPADLIQEKGAVSEEVALKMAEGVLERMQVDCAIAVTGIAGPDGGTPEKPVGTVFAVLKRRGMTPKVLKLMIHGSRKTIIERTANIVFGELYHYCL